jgi:acetyl esterase/lipase
MAWVLTAAAALLALVVAVVAISMLRPVAFDGWGKYGVAALVFPLHLLAVTLVSALLTFVAWWDGATPAAVIFGAIVVLTGVMALWPTIAVWRYARHERVPLSLRTYLVHAKPTFGRPQPERTVVYGTAPDGTKLEMDVWRMADDGGATLHPAVVAVHGGGWVGGTRGEAERWNRWLNELGYTVFDVEYRLPPPERWRDEVGDVKAALGWVREHAAEYTIDPASISLMGHSAGGNLAMLAGYSTADARLPPSLGVPVAAVRSVVNFYGPADLTAVYHSTGSRRYLQQCLQQYIGGSPTDEPDRYRVVSPLSHVGVTTPPTITLLGTRDRIIPVGQARALDHALNGAGVAHETCLLPGNDHGFDVNWGGLGSQVARAKVKAFLDRYG